MSTATSSTDDDWPPMPPLRALQEEARAKRLTGDGMGNGLLPTWRMVSEGHDWDREEIARLGSALADLEDAVAAARVELSDAMLRAWRLGAAQHHMAKYAGYRTQTRNKVRRLINEAILREEAQSQCSRAG